MGARSDADWGFSSNPPYAPTLVYISLDPNALAGDMTFAVYDYTFVIGPFAVATRMGKNWIILLSFAYVNTGHCAQDALYLV